MDKWMCRWMGVCRAGNVWSQSPSIAHLERIVNVGKFHLGALVVDGLAGCGRVASADVARNRCFRDVKKALE